MMRIFITLIVMTGIAFAAIGATSAFATDTTGWTTISVLHPAGSGLHIRVANNKNDPCECGGGNGGFMLLPSNAEQYNLISSVLITAFAAHKEVLIYTNDCTGNGGSLIKGAQVR